MGHPGTGGAHGWAHELRIRVGRTKRPRPDDESAMRILVLGDFSARAQRGVEDYATSRGASLLPSMSTISIA